MLEHLFNRRDEAERLRLMNVGEQQRDRVFADAAILIRAGAGSVGNTTGREGHADFIGFNLGACAFAAQFHPLARGLRDRAITIVTLATLEAFIVSERPHLCFRQPRQFLFSHNDEPLSPQLSGAASRISKWPGTMLLGCHCNCWFGLLWPAAFLIEDDKS